jgi:2-keto-4-pentenoate hydratase/2-oxohepta-3-ene-1,7-dioic acid hydratase in catechol pathway
MKIGRCLHKGHIQLALVHESERQVEFVERLDKGAASSVLDLIVDNCLENDLKGVGSASLDAVEFLAPFPALVRNVLAVGKNYRDHALEFDKSGFNMTGRASAPAYPTHPQFFTKATTSLSGPGQPIRYDEALTQSVDYEGEVAVVIGSTCKNVQPSEAWRHVFGCVLLNDVTARDLQKNHAQWFLGKSLDTFCPMGPWIATSDEIDVSSCTLTTWVNGELRQQANLADLIFDIPTLIAALSSAMTLLPGDVIATGTPAGVGIGFQPPKFLRHGDVVDVTATGLGTLSNKVVTSKEQA